MKAGYWSLKSWNRKIKTGFTGIPIALIIRSYIQIQVGNLYFLSFYQVSGLYLMQPAGVQ